jgi:hypothetical protein
MIALLRYQAAILVRSHRWIFPLIVYGLLIAVGAAGSSSLAETLDWSGAMLVPVTAFLTRAMLTAEPDAARACVAAAAGPVRAQFATLIVPLGGAALLGLAGVAFGVLTAEAAAIAPAGQGLAGKVTAAAQHPGIVAGGLLIALVCLLVGSAAGALCNPPLLRHPAAAMLSTLAAIILGLAANVSPASAAISHTTALPAGPLTAHWPGAGALIGAACVLAVAWGISVAAAARRDNWSPGAS